MLQLQRSLHDTGAETAVEAADTLRIDVENHPAAVNHHLPGAHRLRTPGLPSVWGQTHDGLRQQQRNTHHSPPRDEHHAGLS